MTRKGLTIVSTAGPLYNPRLLVNLSSGATELRLVFQVFFKSIRDDQFSNEVLDQHLKTNLDFFVCPGIPSLPCEVRFKPKKYTRSGHYHFSIMTEVSSSCGINLATIRDQRMIPLYDSCSSCKLLWHDIIVLVKRARQKEPSVKKRHLHPSSKKLLKFLSQVSKKIRFDRARLEQKAMIKSLKHYRKYDVVLNDDQSDELLQLVSQTLENIHYRKFWLKQTLRGVGIYYKRSGKRNRMKD